MDTGERILCFSSWFLVFSEVIVGSAHPGIWSDESDLSDLSDDSDYSDIGKVCGAHPTAGNDI